METTGIGALPDAIWEAGVPRRAVSGRVVLDRMMVRRLRLLRQPRQRVELADDRDHRLAGSERRDERRLIQLLPGRVRHDVEHPVARSTARALSSVAMIGTWLPAMKSATSRPALVESRRATTSFDTSEAAAW